MIVLLPIHLITIVFLPISIITIETFDNATQIVFLPYNYEYLPISINRDI